MTHSTILQDAAYYQYQQQLTLIYSNKQYHEEQWFEVAIIEIGAIKTHN